MEEEAQCEREVVICAREQGGGTLQDGFSGKGGRPIMGQIDCRFEDWGKSCSALPRRPSTFFVHPRILAENSRRTRPAPALLVALPPWLPPSSFLAISAGRPNPGSCVFISSLPWRPQQRARAQQPWGPLREALPLLPLQQPSPRSFTAGLSTRASAAPSTLWLPWSTSRNM